MNRKGIYLIVVAALAAGAILLREGAAQPGRSVTPSTRVAVCDIVEIFDNYQRAKDLTAQMNEEAGKIRAENEKRGKAIDDIKTELENLNPGSKEYEKRLDEIERLTINRKAWLDYMTAKNMRNHHRLTREMYEEIRAMVARVAKERDLKLVIHRNRSKVSSNNTRELLAAIANRKVIYAAEELDLTEVALARLNQAYRALKSK